MNQTHWQVSQDHFKVRCITLPKMEEYMAYKQEAAGLGSLWLQTLLQCDLALDWKVTEKFQLKWDVCHLTCIIHYYCIIRLWNTSLAKICVSNFDTKAHLVINKSHSKTYLQPVNQCSVFLFASSIPVTSSVFPNSLDCLLVGLQKGLNSKIHKSCLFC